MIQMEPVFLRIHTDFPTPSNSLWLQLGVLYFNSVLTLCTWRCHQIHRKELSPTRFFPPLNPPEPPHPTITTMCTDTQFTSLWQAQVIISCASDLLPIDQRFQQTPCFESLIEQLMNSERDFRLPVRKGCDEGQRWTFRWMVWERPGMRRGTELPCPLRVRLLLAPPPVTPWKLSKPHTIGVLERLPHMDRRDCQLHFQPFSFLMNLGGWGWELQLLIMAGLCGDLTSPRGPLRVPS